MDGLFDTAVLPLAVLREYGREGICGRDTAQILSICIIFTKKAHIYNKSTTI